MYVKRSSLANDFLFPHWQKNFFFQTGKWQTFFHTFRDCIGSLCVQPQCKWTPTSSGYLWWLMLLNTKLPLIVTKQLVFFLGPKIINNLLPQMFFWIVYVYNFLTKWHTLVCWYMPHFKDDCDTNVIAILCSKQAPRHIWSVLSGSKKTLYFVPTVCQCMLANCGANTHWLVWSTYMLHTITPTELCITYSEI